MKLPEPEIRFIGPVGDYSEKVQYSTIDDCISWCLDKEELAIDIETSAKYPKNTYKNEDIYQPGLDPYLSVVIMLQIGNEDRIYVIDTRSVDICPLLPVLNDPDKLFIAHNGKFESKHLKYNYGIVFRKIWDTMLVEQNLTNGLQLGYSLAKLSERYLGIKNVDDRDLFSVSDEIDEEDQVYIDKSTRLGFLTIGNKPFTETQILYGADDILYPILIREKQLRGYKGYNPKYVHELENEFCLVLADMELQGITFDQQQWLKNYEDNLVIYNRRKAKLDNWVEQYHEDFCELPDLFRTSKICNIEWSSSKQVVKLFKKIGFCPQEKSKNTGYLEYTVGANALLKLLETDYKERYEREKETDIVIEGQEPAVKDIILNYLLYKVAEQACTTFGKEFLKYVHPITGKLHSSYKQILHTGRISSSKPNCQNIDSKEGYRKAFKAHPGYTLINCDYSSQESRLAAEISEDPDMLSFFNDGHEVFKDDMHSFVGTKMFSLLRNEPDLIVSKKTHPEERQIAKTIGFKIIYGGSAYTLKDDFGVVEEVAQEFIDSYLAVFPGLQKFFDRTQEAALKNGYIEIDPITERRYWFKQFEYMNSLSKKAWDLYPKNYRDLSDERKKEVKEQINKQHPEIKRYWGEYFSLKGSLMRNSQNYPVQGRAGSQTKLAGVLLRRYCIDNNLQDKLYMTAMVHDEICAEAVDEFADQGTDIVIKCMEDGANYFCKKVRMTAAGGKCEWWGH